MDQLVNVFIKFNKETGQLELVKGDLANVKKGADDATLSLGSLKNVLAAVGAGAFLKSAIHDAQEYEKSVDALDAQMRAFGISTKESRDSALKWADAIQESTRFSSDQALGALTKLVGATKDLEAAQRLAQLAFQIATQRNVDQAEVVDNLSKAYAGNERGVRALKGYMDDYNLSVEDTNQLLLLLEKRYHDSTAEGLNQGAQLTQQINKLNDLKRQIGEGLLPAAVKVGEAVNFILKGWQMFYELVAAEATDLVAVFTFISDEMALRWKAGFVDKTKENFQTMTAAIAENHAQFANKVDDINKDHTKDLKKELEIRGELHAAASQKDLAIEKGLIDDELKLIKTRYDEELQQKNLTSERKKEILDKELGEQEAVLDAARAKGLIKEEEYQAKLAQLKADHDKKVGELDQKYADDSAARWEAFTHKIVSQNQIMEKELEDVFDGVSGGFGNAVGRMIVYGEDFKKNFGDAMKSLAAQVISDIVKMELEMLIFKGIGQGNPFSPSVPAAPGASAPVPAPSAPAPSPGGGGTGGLPGFIGNAAIAVGGAVVVGGWYDAIKNYGARSTTTSEQLATLHGKEGFYSALRGDQLNYDLASQYLRTKIVGNGEFAPFSIEDFAAYANMDASQRPLPRGLDFLVSPTTGGALTQAEQEQRWKDWFKQVAGFAKGGVVTEPTLAMIGEAGPERITPLGQEGMMGGVSLTIPQTFHISVAPGTTPEQARELVSMIAEQLKQKTPEAIAMAIRTGNLLSNYGGRAA